MVGARAKHYLLLQRTLLNQIEGSDPVQGSPEPPLLKTAENEVKTVETGQLATESLKASQKVSEWTLSSLVQPDQHLLGLVINFVRKFAEKVENRQILAPGLSGEEDAEERG